MATSVTKSKSKTKQTGVIDTEANLAHNKLVSPIRKISGTKKESVKRTVVISEGKEKKLRGEGDVLIDVVTPEGKVIETMNLPKAIFAAKVNKQLMAQAVRIHLTNKREGSASTKTRGEVAGSTRKIFKQKGTGNARHGSIRAPIFVKGGVALGPKPHDFRLDFPKRMKRASLISALTSQLLSNSVTVVHDISSVEMKTQAFAQMFKLLSCQRKTLMLLAHDELTVMRALRNLQLVETMNVTDVNTYEVLQHRHIVFTKKAVNELEKKYSKEIV